MDTKLKNALKSYGGPLAPEQIDLLRDVQGWIEYCIANGYSLKSTLGVLAHDVNGILADAPFLTPKVRGYAKHLRHLEDLTELGDEPDPNAD